MMFTAILPRAGVCATEPVQVPPLPPGRYRPCSPARACGLLAETLLKERVPESVDAADLP
ncbi:hypothetical protein GCM10010365_01970 [Streptomyces poonensis]|uniref:Uncharacterized protein n=1 Tax=Streptomyces poonensis TaxID=68255 RepID=A0A918UC66_9ACTN|nr:hypothetical protein GCM10010365_01970 [Streptomyces poonensis]GLJ90237.1 hypothetical protein GCM10017589_28400 [Streptomyces poonensis]